MRDKSILISGIGIAGPALAYWLLQHGLRPTLIEQAKAPRSEGYIIDFWGHGYQIVEQMGLMPEVRRAGYDVREVRLVNAQGRRVGGFGVDVFRTATNGRYTSLARGDLSAILYAAVAPHVESLFGNSIRALDDDGDGVAVEFERGPARRFDMVVGADGLHSTVRRLVFGDEARFEKFLGYTVAVFETTGYRPRDEDVYIAYAQPGVQVARFSMRDDKTMFLFVVADAAGRELDPHDRAAHEAYLREHFAAAGWECKQILDTLAHTEDLYFDRVSQIRSDHWSKGRIALVGDAAFAPSLLAGQGSALAVIGAYVLAGELARHARIDDALASYEARLHPFITDKQNAAQGFAGSFAPKTRLGLMARNQISKAFALPFVAKLALGSSLRDAIDLPDYRVSAPAECP